MSNPMPFPFRYPGVEFRVCHGERVSVSMGASYEPGDSLNRVTPLLLVDCAIPVMDMHSSTKKGRRLPVARSSIYFKGQAKG